jgi:hypothetical protein
MPLDENKFIMKTPKIIWLASYPRSGNTFLRTVLWQCFGLRSASIYPYDLGNKKELENYVGHIEHGPNKQIQFPKDNLPLIKTHEHPRDDFPAIYILRDGRKASISLWHFYQKKYSLNIIIEGQHRFGTWANHLQAWKPWERPNTLLLKYEELNTDLPQVLEKISNFLKYKILTNKIPERETIASADGKWVKSVTDYQSEIPENLLERFNQINGEMMQKMGYFS